MSSVPLLFCELAGNLRCNASKDAAPPFIKRAAISNDGTVLQYGDFQTGMPPPTSFDVQEACEGLLEGLERSQMKRSRKADDQATDHHSLYVTADEQQHWTEVRSTEFLDSAPYHKPTPRYHLSDLTILDKIGEGGQGHILEVIRNETSRAVLKEFKSASGSPQGQWPDEILKIENYYLCNLIGYVDRGDGSIGLLMDKYDTDLRKLIDQRLATGSPFSDYQSMLLIASIAVGVKALHDHGVTHRDLKAANILLNVEAETYRNIVLTDFEDSSDVVGTGFWRAPEVLLALHHNRRETLTTIFTPKADIYSFAMTCYEILTGQIPLDNHPRSDYNVILLDHRRPQLPSHVNPSLAALIHRCWHQDPNLRPTASQLVSEIEHLVSEDPSLSRILVHLIYDEYLEGPQSETSHSPLEYLDELQGNLTSQRGFLTPLGFVAGCSYVAEVKKFIHEFGSEVTAENAQAATVMGLAIGKYSGTVQGDVMAPLWWDNVSRPVTKLVLKLFFKSGGWIAYVLRSYNKRVAMER
jgi:serine/threonine protein kinase